VRGDSCRLFPQRDKSGAPGIAADLRLIRVSLGKRELRNWRSIGEGEGP
jgi:hypothetical protein